MSVCTVVGAQWGDEGKGKIVDLLAENADIIARWGGGPNAGHTVVVKNEKFVLHHIPSGILNPKTINLLGAGVVIDPIVLLKEVDGLVARGIEVEGRLFLDPRAHCIFSYHQRLDAAQEKVAKIGTTKRGIGPAYTDKYARFGIRIGDFSNESHLTARLKAECERMNHQLKQVYGESPMDIQTVLDEILPLRTKIARWIRDVSLELNFGLKQGKNILLEGAQGTLLDINFGTYPFVTSSESIAGGASAGLGLGPKHLTEVIGVAKAYVTRVGNGPFPTEETSEIGEQLRHYGSEFGSTTGRPRRCGWWDNVVANYAVRVNGLTAWAITKLDILCGFPKIHYCTAYDTPYGLTTEFPTDGQILAQVKPIYETVEGWEGPIHHCRTFEALPKAAQNYIQMIEQLTQTPVKYISVGEKRDETIVR
ncbi:MAG: adenylosuccinate synthase [bacterium]|nr:adenylosuccinate synthase [bacterium]